MRLGAEPAAAAAAAAASAAASAASAASVMVTTLAGGFSAGLAGPRRGGLGARGCTASSKVGKKPRKGLCLERKPVRGRKLEVVPVPSHSGTR